MPESNNIQPVVGHPYSELARPVQPRDAFRPRGIKWVKAARALAEGKTHIEAAQVAGVAISAVYRWNRSRTFKALLNRYLEEIERQAVTVIVARKAARLVRLDRQRGKLERIMEERGEALDGVVAGGGTGLISHNQKTLGSGPLAQIVDVYEFDAALSREYRGVLEQAAKEIGGQFEQGAVCSGPGTAVNVSISFPVMAKEQLEAVNSAPVIDLPPMARRLLSRPSDGKQR